MIANAVLVREALKGFFYARLCDGLCEIKLRHFVQFASYENLLVCGRLVVVYVEYVRSYFMPG